jgi:hypothetical protein
MACTAPENSDGSHKPNRPEDDTGTVDTDTDTEETADTDTGEPCLGDRVLVGGEGCWFNGSGRGECGSLQGDAIVDTFECHGEFDGVTWFLSSSSSGAFEIVEVPTSMESVEATFDIPDHSTFDFQCIFGWCSGEAWVNITGEVN